MKVTSALRVVWYFWIALRQLPWSRRVFKIKNASSNFITSFRNIYLISNDSLENLQYFVTPSMFSSVLENLQKEMLKKEA